MESKMEMLFCFKNCPSDQDKLKAENLKKMLRSLMGIHFIFKTVFPRSLFDTIAKKWYFHQTFQANHS